MTTQRKWFGVTKFEYKPVNYALLKSVRRRMAPLNRLIRQLWRSIHGDGAATAEMLNAKIAEARAIESELYVKVEA